MMKKVVALLDKPSPKSFGMVPIVIEEGEGLKVLGLSVASKHREGLNKEELNDLVGGGHARGVDATFMWSPIPIYVALWLGNDFADLAHITSLPLPRLPSETGCHRVEDGCFLITDAVIAHGALVIWTNSAFECFLQRKDVLSRHEIARVMIWCLPDHEQTLAARWNSSPKPDRELDLQLRTWKRGTDAASWKTRLEHLLTASGG